MKSECWKQHAVGTVFGFLLSFLCASGLWAQTSASTPQVNPHLSGPIGQAAFPTEALVCPGSPVVLTVALAPPSAIAEGGNPVISFEVLEGNGWFKPFEELRAAPLGRIGLWWGGLLASFGNNRILAALDAESGSTAVVFHPLGKAGDTIRVRARAEGPNADLGSVDFNFKIGANHESELSRLAPRGLSAEKNLDFLNYQFDEYVDMKTADVTGRWRGTPLHIQRTFIDATLISKYLESKAAPVTTTRQPYDLEHSLYLRSRYWGETDDCYIGCLCDPEPPGRDGALMLYYFDKGTGLLRDFRFYGSHTCGWGHFTWNMDAGDGHPFTVQIEKRTWDPPTQIHETVDIFRQNIMFLTVLQAAQALPSPLIENDKDQ